VQPYLSLALHLVQSHSHRVRLATHPDFKDFVLEGNKRLKGKTGKDGRKLDGLLEYFDVGGSPKELMAYMVKSELFAKTQDRSKLTLGPRSTSRLGVTAKR